MAFTISVPAVLGQPARLVLCNVADEIVALNEAERLLGYRISGLPYIVSEISLDGLQALNLPEGVCALARLSKGD